ncbi:MAG: hypothetical protein HYZ53_27120, partial [Planctomycetes bacterium]|nr:hypothetical protein [Planctomycetota bacterium]
MSPSDLSHSLSRALSLPRVRLSPRHRALPASVPLLALALLGAFALAGDRDPESRLAAAERAFAEGSYKKALAGFEGVGRTDPEFASRPSVRWRIAQCLLRLDRWGDAETAAAALLKAHPASLWEVRAEGVLGRLFSARPHYGYQVGDRFVRGNTEEEGTYVSTWTDDLRAAVAHLEHAKAVAAPLLASTPEDLELRAEALDVNLALASVLAGADSLFAPAETDMPRRWKDARPADARAYDPAWPLWDKLPFLYEEVVLLDADPDRVASQRALAAKAAFYLRHASDFDRPENGAVPAAHDPAAILRDALARFPDSPAAHETHYALAAYFLQAAAFPEAVAEFERFLEAHRQSKWAGDAGYHLQELRRPRLALEAPPPTIPGAKVEAKLSSRNVKKVAFVARKVKLDALLDKSSFTEDWNRSLQGLADAVLRERRSRADALGAKVAEWEVETGDDGAYKPLERAVAFPLPTRESGLYLVSASAEKITTSVLVLLTDLALVERSSRDGFLFFAADALTGEPVGDAEVLVRQYADVTEAGKAHRTGQVTRERTGADGLCRVAPMTVAEGNSLRVEAVARKAGRIALTPNLWWYSPGRGAAAATDVLYVHTDRPVYRPGQAVFWKGILRRRTRGEYANLPGARLRLAVNDARGGKVLETEVTTSEFGSFHGQLALPEGAPLGTWSLEVERPDGGSLECSPGQFQVEEYKKPEVEVAVTPDAAHVKLGEPAAVVVAARYYFGAPAAAASVAWRVFRTPFTPTHRRPGPWDWYYGGGYEGEGPGGEGPAGRELVAEGHGTTDAEGRLRVPFETAKAAHDFPEQDQRYEVAVEVTDKSRHVVEASGGVTVTRREFFAFLVPRQGFYLPGDQVELELATTTPDDEPRPAKGRVTVARVTYAGEKNDQPVETRVQEDDLITDGDGRAFFKWQSDAPGLFKVAFEAADHWGGTVAGSTHVWVASKETNEVEGGALHFRDLDVITDKRTYLEGESIHVFLSSNWPGQTVLLTEEFGHDIRSAQVLPLRGKTRVLDLPVERGHRPNFFLRAMAVRNGRLYEERREIFVPPASELLGVSLSTDKATYRPGDKGRVTARVTDADGKPVRCELSLSAYDRSVLYIQPETAADPRLFFHGGRRWLETGVESGLGFRFEGMTRDGNAIRRFKLHGMPPGWGEVAGSPDGASFDLYSAMPDSGAATGGAAAPGRAGAITTWKAEPSRPAEAPAPATPPAAKPGPAQGIAAGSGGGRGAGGGGGGGMGGRGRVEPAVRSHFADSALWVPDLVTGADGSAEAEFTCPDSLTAWQLGARGFTGATQVGAATGGFVTSKNLLIRVAAPRFLAERDEATVSTLVHNYLATAKKVDMSLSLAGGLLEASNAAPRTVEVPAGGERRVDWSLRAVRGGQATVLAKALTDEESDAMEVALPVHVHGADKGLSWSGSLPDGGPESATVEVDVPAERRVDNARLTVRVYPTRLAIALDALPYLLEYPYGCVEQTLSRFLPAVQVAATLSELGIRLEDVAARRREAVSDGNLRPAGWCGHDPVFDSRELSRIVRAGLDRLYDAQNGDGGWGWWRGDGSDPYMTAYVVGGLRTARTAGIEVDADRLARGEKLLAKRAADEEDLECAAYVAGVLADGKKSGAALLDRLYDRRIGLSGYGRALLALALANAGDTKRATVVCENIADFLSVDEKAGTCCWTRRPADVAWRWYHDDVETNAAILRAYLRVLPDDARVPLLAEGLVRSRVGVRWKSTKDSAFAIGALCEFARARRELEPDFTATVAYEGIAKKVARVRKDNLFAFDGELSVVGDAVQDGRRRVTIRREGTGSLYWSVELRYFTQEEDVQGSSNGVSVTRAYARLVPRAVKRTVEGKELTELEYDRQPLVAGEELASGEEVEVRLSLEAENEYEYLLVEDPKPAGCEPVDVRSGERYGGGLCSNV